MLSFRDYSDMSYKAFYAYIVMDTRLSLFKFVVKKWHYLPLKKTKEEQRKERREENNAKKANCCGAAVFAKKTCDFVLH